MTTLNNYKVTGFKMVSGFKIDLIKTESCKRLVQYSRMLPITCACSLCKHKNQTPEEAKIILDLKHNK